MSDISATADFAAEASVDSSTEGLTDVSTPTESFDTGESITQESDVTSTDTSTEIEALFELEGQKITLDEARNGYLRQSDYTRKTQELSEMRSRLQQAEAITAALESDPVATLQALSEAFGVQMQAQPSNPYEGLDPEQARIAALEAKFAQQEETARQAQIDAELEGLKSSFGEVDESALFAHAIKGNFPSLKAAYADMHFEAVAARARELESAKAEEAKRIQAKKEASVVQGGASRSGATDSQPQQFGSLRDAYLAAKKAVGVA